MLDPSGLVQSTRLCLEVGGFSYYISELGMIGYLHSCYPSNEHSSKNKESRAYGSIYCSARTLRHKIVVNKPKV